MVDWDFALTIFIFGFSAVFICLVTLMTVIKLVGKLFQKLETSGKSA